MWSPANGTFFLVVHRSAAGSYSRTACVPPLPPIKYNRPAETAAVYSSAGVGSGAFFPVTQRPRGWASMDHVPIHNVAAIAAIMRNIGAHPTMRCGECCGEYTAFTEAPVHSSIGEVGMN